MNYGPIARLAILLIWHKNREIKLTDARIREIIAEIHHVGKTIKNPKDDLADLLRTMSKLLLMYLRRLLFRKFIKLSLSIPRNLFEYFGQGIYVGRKQAELS